jgi:hypothetical protein
MSIIYIYPEILACNRNRLGQKLASRREPHQIRPHYFEHKLMQRICQAFRFNGTRPETLRDSSWSWQYKSIFPFSSFFPFFKRLHHFASPKHVQHVLSGNSIPAKPGVRVWNIKVPSGGLCRKSCHYNTLRLTLGDSPAPEPFTNVYEVLQLFEGELVELVELVEPMKSLAFAWFLVSVLFGFGLYAVVSMKSSKTQPWHASSPVLMFPPMLGVAASGCIWGIKSVSLEWLDSD